VRHDIRSHYSQQQANLEKGFYQTLYEKLQTLGLLNLMNDPLPSGKTSKKSQSKQKQQLAQIGLHSSQKLQQPAVDFETQKGQIHALITRARDRPEILASLPDISLMLENHNLSIRSMQKEFDGVI